MASARKSRIKPVDQREFPPHPRIGVGGVVIDRGCVLLVRRGQEPLKGEWSIPGGLVEVGEALNEAVEREIQEETGLLVKSVGMLGVFERVIRARKPQALRGRVRYHYVLIEFVCELRRDSGRSSQPPQPRTDVTDARWVSERELEDFRLSATARKVIQEAFRSLRKSAVECPV
jgi:8-oxo-dGTP diphosphatase